ncbi:VanZ family protein [Clostridium sp. MSJ-4]|uniref:VanZ family protein n=1 Tax=Clostridium simiarum TaxID=2841506 RepID=A0ABS6F6G4_9CLOT|nr:VanZ family protein [Clostridium simiarum]MBU5593454.1 VanZ family protein [Clostridium simiarum]
MMFSRMAVFVIGVPLLGLITSFRYVKSRKSIKNFFSKRELLGNMMYVYLLCVVALTIFPLKINLTRPSNLEPGINVIPVFNTLKDMSLISDSTMKSYMLRFWIKNIVGNLILLMPLGVIAPILWKRFRNVKSILLLCFCTTLTMECLQYISSFLGNR